MDNFSAFAKGAQGRRNGDKQMIFDWDKAARLIKERNPKVASAGLKGDWEYTGGIIYTKKRSINAKEYTYLSSTWATPELDLDGEIIECYIMEDDNPNKWDNATSWPQSALDILRG